VTHINSYFQLKGYISSLNTYLEPHFNPVMWT